jgi:GTPase SAR1 family protein/uncharacterized tellurite resistance protein B-like protein
MCKKTKATRKSRIIPKRIVSDIDDLSPERKILFYYSFFSLIGKMAAIDGKVSKEEINVVDSILKNDLQLSDTDVKAAREMFNSAQHSDASEVEIVTEFKSVFNDDHILLHELVETLFRVSYSDGKYDSNEELFIKSITRILDISHHEYERIKAQFYFEMIILKLLAAIEKLPYSNTTSEAKRQLRILFTSIHSPFLVTVLGEFNAGKSTFINALINKKLLAMKIRPTTATITKLHYGCSDKLDVHFIDGSMKTFDKADLHTLTVENYINEEEILSRIFCVSLDVEDELLRNIDIADTPGFNSSNVRHTEITSNYIAYSDAIIWVFDGNQMAKKSTFDLIEEYCKYEKPIGIINKVDLIDNHEEESIIGDLMETLKPHTKEVFAISSKMAINAQQNDGNQSGINNVREYLVEEIIPTAVENKSKITLIKLIKAIMCLESGRGNLVNYIRGFEKRLKIYETEVTEHKRQLDKYNESVKSLEKDKNNEDKSYYDILINVKNYFIGSTIPKVIEERTKEYITEYRNLKTDATLLDAWLASIENQNVSLVEYRKEYDAYSEFVRKNQNNWERYNTSLANYVHNVNDRVLERGSVLDSTSDRLREELEHLEQGYTQYINTQEVNQVYENDLLEISCEISQLFDIKTNQSNSAAFTDFESLIVNLQAQYGEFTKLGEKQAYNRETLSEAIDVS